MLAQTAQGLSNKENVQYRPTAGLFKGPNTKVPGIINHEQHRRYEFIQLIRLGSSQSFSRASRDCFLCIPTTSMQNSQTLPHTEPESNSPYLTKVNGSQHTGGSQLLSDSVKANVRPRTIAQYGRRQETKLPSTTN